MRRFDKKLNIDKVNLLFEQRYLKSKDIVNENLSELEEDWKTNLAAGLASLVGSAGSAKTIDPKLPSTTQTTQRASSPRPQTTNVKDPFNINPKTKSNSLLTVNFSNSFESGGYRLNKNFQKGSINKIKEYIINNPDTNYVIYITASESKVPNQKGFDVGDLAKKRSEIIKELLVSNIPMGNVEIKVEAIVDGPEWDNGNKNDKKYIEHQYVIIELFNAGTTPCALNSMKNRGKIATEDNGFISNNFTVTGNGSFEMTPGSIPDRLELIKDGKVIFDTRYYADKNLYAKEWKYTPLYIANLSELYVANKNLKAFENVSQDVKTFRSYEELIDFILNDKNLNIEKDTRREVKEGLDKLKQLWAAGQTEYLFYTIKPPSIATVEADVKHPIQLKTYSPLGSTQFGLRGINCK
jgi:hypothetical protein